jgi:signal transduction histidine kinase
MTDPHTMVPGGPAWRILCLGTTPGGTMALSALVSSVLPEASVDVLDLRTVSSLPDADLIVVDADTDGETAIEHVRTVRARGGTAPTVLVGSAPPLTERASLGDVSVAAPGALTEALPNAVAAIAARWAEQADDPRVAALWQAVHETRQLVAAGRIARRVKHDLNNPLAALLAEAQLLELDELGDDAREAVARIVELTRRVIDQARLLEGPKGDGAGPASA